MGSTKQSPPFRIERMVRTDFSEMLRPSNRRGGDLTTAPIPLCWPVPEDGDPRADDEALSRLEYSSLQMRKFFDVDPTAHWIKAVTPDGEIASIARWNFFPHGYDFEKDELVDVAEFVPEGALEHYKIDLYRMIRTGMMRLRKEWMLPKGPAWVLMAMVTRKCHRRQGAASMLVEWGREKAEKDGVPAYLEASAQGKPVYERCGFHQVGELVPWDCRPHGIDLVFNGAKMAWYPS